MNLPTLKGMASLSLWLTSHSAYALKNLKREHPVKAYVDWEEEKQDILERANWLSEQIIDNSATLVKRTVDFLGPQYGGQWAIYAAVHYCAALANIARLYPEEKAVCLERMMKTIDIINTKEVRNYDYIEWKEDAIETLSGKKSHITYISTLAWAITEYKLAGGEDGRYDDLLDLLCEAINRRMLASPDLNLPSFPNKIIFIPDMMTAIVALTNYAKLNNGQYADTVQQWLDRAKHGEWTHKRSGLLIAYYNYWRHPKYRPIRGSYTSMACYCLTKVDEAFARDQHIRMLQSLGHTARVLGVEVHGIKEYLYKAPAFKFDCDAGPIVQGLSPSGTAWAIGSATYFGDWELRSQLLRSAEIAGCTVREEGSRHYKLGELALVGEAVVLAMRTNTAKFS